MYLRLNIKFKLHENIIMFAQRVFLFVYVYVYNFMQCIFLYFIYRDNDYIHVHAYYNYGNIVFVTGFSFTFETLQCNFV